MLSAEDIQKIENKKKEIKKETYRRIFEQFSKKIKLSVEMGQKYAKLSVPPFILGYPTYDLSKAAVYLKRQLENSGFNVTMVDTITLEVTWSKNNKSVKNVKRPPEPEDEYSLPSLINLKKLANKHKNA
jgi:hypothetical protein